MVRVVVGNGGNGKDIITLLFNQQRSKIKIIKKVVRVVAGNRGNGKDIITLLLN